jgi:predicted phage-related endonuclease
VIAWYNIYRGQGKKPLPDLLKNKEDMKMSNQILQEKIREYREYKQLIEEAQANADSIADELKAHMNAQGVDEMAVDVFKVRYKEVTSSRVDTSTMKKELPDVVMKYTKTTTSKRFSVA